jgi:hypothetical protein
MVASLTQIGSKGRHKAFDTFTFLIAWCLWLQRNDRVFNHGSLPPPALVLAFGL